MHRLTQTVDVTVYKLTVANTVEGRILDLQEKKRLLAQQAIESGAKKDALKLGLAELVDLFKPGGHYTGGDANTAETPAPNEPSNRPLGMLATKKNDVNRRQESSIYGRRW